MDRRTLLTDMSGAAAESLLKAGRIKAMPDWKRRCAGTCSTRP